MAHISAPFHMDLMTTHFTTLPAESRLHSYMQAGDFIDCVETNPIDPKVSLSELTRRLMASQPRWMPAALLLRDALVAPFGIKTGSSLMENDAGTADTAADLSEGDYVAFLQVREIHSNEIILGENDRHLNFRVTLFKPTPTSDRVFMATWVHRNNLLGRIYLAAIMPFHKAVVYQMAKGLAPDRAAS
jgi:hypothetical protein